MKIVDLFEANIPTVKTDLAVRDILHQAIPRIANYILAGIHRNVGQPDNSTEYQEKLEKFFEKYQNSVIKELCLRLSKILSDVLKPIKVKLGWHDKKEYMSGQIQFHNNTMPIEISYNTLVDFIGHLIGENFQETDDPFVEEFINELAPLVLHEYDHFTKNLKSKVGYRDFGYITTGAKNTSGKGKRGGADIRGDNLRYWGSVHEIEAYATDAASIIWHSIKKDNRNPKNVLEFFRNQLSGSEPIAYNNTSMQQYTRLLHHVLVGELKDSGYKEDEIHKVWKRYVKRVYQKLIDYIST